MSNVREFWTLRVQNCANGPSARSRSLTLKVQDIYRLQLGIFRFHARARGEYATQRNILTRGTNLTLSVRQPLTTAKRSISYAGPTFWNSSPPDIRSIDNFKRFKKSLKEHLLSFYQETVDS